MDTALNITRVCGALMNQIVHELGFGNRGEWFDGDDPAQWAIVHEREIRCIKHNVLTAEIFLDEVMAEVSVPDVHSLVRAEHLADFNYRDHGIQDRPPMLVGTNLQPPQIVVKCSLPDEEILPKGPRQYLPTTTWKRKPTLRGSLH